MERHIPVLKKEIIKFLNVKANRNFVDCTFGQGGHSLEILKKNQPKGKVLGIEIDPFLVKMAKKEIKNKRLILVNDSFVNLKKIIKKTGFVNIYGILLDLGISIFHIKNSKRGFTFKKNEILNMRYDGKSHNVMDAKRIINELPKENLVKIFKNFGQIKSAKIVAEKILPQRPIATTFQLIETLKDIREKNLIRKVFLALRIASNCELENLKDVLPQTIDVLISGGRLVVISYHSLEDKIVKNFFRENRHRLKILTQKPITPSAKELLENPRSRSAKLRAAEKK